jgi:hypothetical protein
VNGKIRAIVASKQTTAGAVLLAIITILQAVRFLIDGDPATNPDWNEVISFLTLAWVALMARDAAVSDQASGVRPEKESK